VLGVRIAQVNVSARQLSLVPQKRAEGGNSGRRRRRKKRRN
jgi:hypothetical protein